MGIRFFAGCSPAGADDAPNYNKYGCYGTLNTGSVTVKWRAARNYMDGYPSKVELYQGCSYGGWKASFVAGDYTLADLQASAGNRLLATAGQRGTKPRSVGNRGQWATGSRRPARVASAAQRAPR